MNEEGEHIHTSVTNTYHLSPISKSVVFYLRGEATYLLVTPYNYNNKSPRIPSESVAVFCYMWG